MATGRRTAPARSRRPRPAAIVLAPVAAAATLLAVLSVPAAGQAPGYQQIDPGSIRAEYTAEVLDRINDLLADWGDAWAGDRPEELSDLDWEDAILIPP